MKTNKVPMFILQESGITYDIVNVKDSKDTYKLALSFYKDGSIGIYESMYIIYLNNTNNTVGHLKLSQGGISGTVVDIRLAAKGALDCLATGAIIIHNHPSGKLIPSNNDKTITTRLKEALNTLDIKLLDHLIVTKENYYSFVDEGLIF